MAQPDSTLDLIRKLLAKAERTTIDAEREAYNGKAAELIAKYGIAAVLAAAAAADAAPLIPGDRIVRIPAPYSRDKAVLLSVIAKACRVEAVLRSTRGGDYGADVHLFGFAADLERVEVLFTSLLVQAAYGLARVRPDSMPANPYARRPESITSYRRTWLAGFTHEIGQRLTAAERKAQAEATPTTPGVALVLRDRDAAVKAAVSVVYPRLRAQARRLSGSGYGAGQTAGRNADLGGSRIGGGGARRSLVG